MVLSNVVSAKDIWCWTRETSQGAVYEYYLVTETFQQISSQELRIDIKIVRKDKWGRTEKPRITVWTFIKEKDLVCTVRNKDQEESKAKIKVADDPAAVQIYQRVIEYIKGEYDR